MQNYYYRTGRNSDVCNKVVATIEDDAKNRLYEITENSDKFPFCTIHDESELPGTDTDTEDMNEWELVEMDACKKYITNGGSYPFVVIRTPYQTPDATFTVYQAEGKGAFTDWTDLLNEWETYENSSQTEYFDSSDVADMIEDALKDDNFYKAETIIQGVFCVSESWSKQFASLLNELRFHNKNGDKLDELIRQDDDRINAIHEISETEREWIEWEELPAEDDWKDGESSFCAGVHYFDDFLSQKGNENFHIPAKDNGQPDWDNLDKETEMYGAGAWRDYCESKEDEEVGRVKDVIEKAVKKIDADFGTTLVDCFF